MVKTDTGGPGRKADSGNGLKISELSDVTGVSKQAIHFYLREGLLHPGKKTSPNMAYYDDSHVERIRSIKKLQESHRLKLSEIKEVLSGGGASVENGAAVLAAFGFLPVPSPTLSAGELVKKSGITKKDFEKLLKSGLITAADEERGRKFSVASLELARLSKKILDAGYSDDYLINVLGIFKDVSEELAKREIENYFSRPLTGADMGKLADTFRNTEPFLETAFWLLRRIALGEQAGRIIDDFSLFSWMTGREFKSGDNTILPSAGYLEPLGLPGMINDLKEITEEGRGDAISFITLAIIYYAKGDRKEQLRWISRALESDPENRWALLLLGDAYSDSTRAGEAEEILSRCCELYPDFALAHCLLATAMLQSAINKKRVENVIAAITGALHELEQAGELAAPEGFENLLLRSLRGRALLLLPDFMGVFDQAVDELKRAQESGEKEKKKAAEPYYRTAVDSLLMNVYYDIGRAAERTGNLRERDRSWKKLLSLDPDNRIASQIKRKMD